MRIILLLVALYQATNGLFMLAMPELWYQNIPDVTHTGPLNTHFVRDIGFGFLAAALSLALAARRRGADATIWPGAAFLGGHAVLHLTEMALHGIAPLAGARDIATIVVPGLTPLAVALWAHRHGPQEARA
ncbi:MAG: hypothetical protein ABJG86_16620 [Nitratireductor sp.]